MREMLAGRLPFQIAVEQGLIVIDAGEMQREILLTAWQAAYPARGFSRFVCT